MSSSTDSTDRTNGRWTKHEHQNFLLGLQMHGRNWKKIQELIGTRNGSQIRSHAQKFFLKVKKAYPTESSTPQDIDQSLAEIESNNSKPFSEHETKTSEYSYFLGKIVQYSSSQGPFDFWNCLIDHQKKKSFFLEENQTYRKNSVQQSDDEQNQVEKLSFPQKKVKI